MPRHCLEGALLPAASVFLSHTHVDKPFVRRLGADLAALGARVWTDEAELRASDSLLAKISKAIDDMEYLAVVLSPEAAASSWVQDGSSKPCLGNWRGTGSRCCLSTTVRAISPASSEARFMPISPMASATMGTFHACRILDLHEGVGGTLSDPYARQFGRHSGMPSRPVKWLLHPMRHWPDAQLQRLHVYRMRRLETVHGWQRHDAGLPSLPSDEPARGTVL